MSMLDGPMQGHIAIIVTDTSASLVMYEQPNDFFMAWNERN